MGLQQFLVRSPSFHMRYQRVGQQARALDDVLPRRDGRVDVKPLEPPRQRRLRRD